MSRGNFFFRSFDDTSSLAAEVLSSFSRPVQRMRQQNVFMSTTESVIFSLIGDSKHPKFKDVQKLIMKPLPPSGLCA